MSATIHDHARRTGIRTDLTAFALLTATIKLSGALSAFMLGLLLDGFKTNAPMTMLALGLITVGGGLCFLLVGTPVRSSDGPTLPQGRGAFASGSGRATPPPGSLTTYDVPKLLPGCSKSVVTIWAPLAKAASARVMSLILAS